MRRTTITLPSKLIEKLMEELNAKTKTEAVIKAINDEIRLRKKEKIKAMAGKMEFSKDAETLRHGDDRLG